MDYDLLRKYRDRLGADVSMCMLQTFDETGEHATACSYDQVIPQELDRAAFTWQDLGTDLFKLRFASCNKVYARSFLERQGVRYSEDRYYEDLIFTFRALLEARALTFVREPLYLNRKGREEATTYVQGDRVMDAITSLEELQDLIEQDEAYTGLAAAFHAFAFRKMLVYLAQVDADHIDAFLPVLDELVKEKDSLALALEKGPTAASNLHVAFDSRTGSIGSRVNVDGNIEDLDGFLCAMVKNASIPDDELACEVFEQLLEGSGMRMPSAGNRMPAPDARVPGEAEPAEGLDELLGGGGR
jgi:hypothetical protein